MSSLYVMQVEEPRYESMTPHTNGHEVDPYLRQDVNVLRLASSKGEATQLQQLGWVEGKSSLPTSYENV